MEALWIMSSCLTVGWTCLSWTPLRPYWFEFPTAVFPSTLCGAPCDQAALHLNRAPILYIYLPSLFLLYTVVYRYIVAFYCSSKNPNLLYIYIQFLAALSYISYTPRYSWRVVIISILLFCCPLYALCPYDACWMLDATLNFKQGCRKNIFLS